MQNPLFLKNSDRRKLHQLKTIVERLTDHEQIKSARKQIAEIESRRKPLSECDLDECIEFQGYVADMRAKMAASAPHLAKTLEQLSNSIQFKIMEIGETQEIEMFRAATEAEFSFNNISKPKKKKKPRDLQSSDGNPRNKWMVSGLDDNDD